MARTQRVLVVAFVATALAADRLGAAAPVLRPNNMVVAARQLAGRLAVGFRRAVIIVRYQPFRRDDRPANAVFASLSTGVRLQVHPCEYSPFQFRLPPPVA